MFEDNCLSGAVSASPHHYSLHTAAVSRVTEVAVVVVVVVVAAGLEIVVAVEEWFCLSCISQMKFLFSPQFPFLNNPL